MTSHDTHDDLAPGGPVQAAALDPSLFDAVAADLLSEHPGDQIGRMLQSPALKAAGRYYAFATRTHIIVKLPADRVATLVRHGIGSPCDPRGGHPMRQWVLLAPPDPDTAIAYVRDARAFVVASNGRTDT